MDNQNRLYQKGDILMFHTRNSPFAWAIRQVTGSFWNHTAIVVDDKNIVEALGKGVVTNPILNYMGNKHYELSMLRIKESAFKNPQENIEAIKIAVERANLSIGKKYDWGAIAGLGIKYWLRAINKWTRLDKFFAKHNIFQNRYNFFCSELVCACYTNTSSIEKYLFKGKNNTTCQTTTPKDINKSQYVKVVWGLIVE